MQLTEQHLVQLLPDSGILPLGQPAPAGRPEAPNNDVGSRFHPIPVRATHKIPANAARSGVRSRPGCFNRLRRTGISGSNRAHN